MNKTNVQNMEKHVTILGWLYVGMSALLVAIAIITFFFVVLGGALSGDPEAVAVTGIVGFGIAAVMMLFAIPGFFAGYGLLKQKSWARPLSFILAVLNVFSFPVGTAVSVYTFWVLMQDEVVALFTTEKQVAY